MEFDPIPKEEIQRALLTAWPLDSWADVPILVAVSGGPDSVALLRVLLAVRPAAKSALHVAHFNHRLRGTDADADEAFVRQLCGDHDLPYYAGHAEQRLATPVGGDGVEAAARRARYGFFRQAADRVGARFLATAHTADDQAETVLHHILRGTGISGLAGIRPVRRLSHATTLIRPLLAVRRQLIIAYLESIGQAYRIDRSNDDTRFTRNRIRHGLMPEIARQFNPNVVDALLRLGHLAGEIESATSYWVEQLVEEYVTFHGQDGEEVPVVRIEIGMHALIGQPQYIFREVLIKAWKLAGWPRRAMGFGRWHELAALGLAGTGRTESGHSQRQTPQMLKRMFPGAVTAEAGPEKLVLWRAR